MIILIFGLQIITELLVHEKAMAKTMKATSPVQQQTPTGQSTAATNDINDTEPEELQPISYPQERQSPVMYQQLPNIRSVRSMAYY